jgi:hypothetical protein
MMMQCLHKRILFTLVLSGTVLLAAAQVIITPQIPPTGLLQKDQLWNLVVVNNNDLPQDMQIQMAMLDMKTRQKILTGTSRPLTLTKGARQLRISDVGPVQYNYTSADMVTDRTSNGLLPIGRYQVCYTLILVDAHKSGLPAQEECIPAEVQPLNPPQLNYPANKDTITTNYPVLQWLPPAPINLFSDLNYQLILVELNKGQNVNDAIQKNTPIYTQDRVKDLYFNYSSSTNALENGKTYGWQIIAKNGNSYAEKTEAWQFTVRKDSATIILDNEAYPALKQGTTGAYYICQGKIRFSYNNEIADSSVLIQFYEGQNDKQVIFSNLAKTERGQNYLDININSNRFFREGKSYVMELINSRKESWTLRFKYEPSPPAPLR